MAQKLNIGKYTLLSSIALVSSCFTPNIVQASEQQKRHTDKTVIFAKEALLIAGQDVKKNVIIEINDGHITKIKSDQKKPSPTPPENGQKYIDLSCCFVMPGFIDTHVHLTTFQPPKRGEDTTVSTAADLSLLAGLSAKNIIEAGFTTVMDMGIGHRDHELAIYAVKNAIAEGMIPGPDIMAAGSPLSATGYSRHGKFRDELEHIIGPEGVCDSPDSCRHRVREQVKRGADFINVYHTGSMMRKNSVPQTLTTEELRAIADTAKMLGRVAVADGGNTPSDASGIKNALKAGFTVIDTVTYPDDETFKLLKEKDGYFAPHVYALLISVGDSLETLESGTMGWLPKSMLEHLYAIKITTPSAVAGYKAGANLILSSDSGVFPHGDNAHEMIAYTDLGISITDTLKAATINAAKAYKIFNRTGSLERGKEADIIALTENPYKNIKTVLDVPFVMSNGQVYRQEIK